MKDVSMQEAWEDLANAVILAAVDEYKQDLIHLARNPDSKAAQARAARQEQFFYSDWYDTLTNMDGRRLIRKLKEIIADKYGQSRE